MKKILIIILVIISVNTFSVLISVNNIYPSVYYSLEQKSSKSPFQKETLTTSSDIKKAYARTGLKYLKPVFNNTNQSTKILDELEIFTQDEIEHLSDLKILIKNIFILFNISIIALTILIIFEIIENKIPEYLKNIQAGLKLNLIGIFLVGFCTVFLWKKIFIIFHKIFFPQGNWQFPVDSMLINLYPPQFWMGYAGFLMTINVLLSIILLIVIKKISVLNLKTIV